MIDKAQKIAKSIYACNIKNDCYKCAYNMVDGDCITKMETDAAEIISTLIDELKKTKCERDQLIDDIYTVIDNGVCSVCDSINCEICDKKGSEFMWQGLNSERG